MSRAAAARPPTRTTERSHGCQAGERSSRTNDQTAVAAMMPARHSRQAIFERWAHSVVAPMPTSAPIAGARATA